ncbi:hypothetical protein KIV63_gp46 [Mycobacterium phage SWU2]|uniref:Uncharacterized protein n=1 Tax=Mycobacterium phage SWU2 TaxID=2077150 RepID=A0A2K9VI90_9CAUD|nr:hypothetical protein KIV63_gp46 [Mycobacterium phage SWU2]AUV61998.1 hypothetical protein JX_gp39 [Mycobacterium phage SWU2]
MNHEIRRTTEIVVNVFSEQRDVVRCRNLVEALQEVPNGAIPVSGSFGNKCMTLVFKQPEAG